MTDRAPSGTSHTPPTADFSFARRVAVGTAIVVLVWALSQALWIIIDPLLLVFLAVVFAIGLRGAALWIHRKTGLPTVAALVAVVLAVYVAPITGAVVLVTQADEQVEKLREDLPKARERVDAWMEKLDWRALIGATSEGGPPPAPAPTEVPGATETALNAMEGGGSPSGEGGDTPSKALGLVTGFIGTAGGAIAGFLFVLVVSIYLAGSPKLYEGGLLKLFPKKIRSKARDVFDEINDQLQRWIVGQFVAGTIVAIGTSIALYAIGLPMSLLFGVLAGIFDFIPNFGPAVAALPAIIVASGDGKILPVVITFAAIQGLEGWILRPLIERRAVDTPPAVLLATQVAAGVLFGFLGLLLAPAIIVVVRILLMRLWIEEALGDDADVPVRT